MLDDGAELALIDVREELSAAPLIAVSKSELPMTPAASYFLDLLRRSTNRQNPK